MPYTTGLARQTAELHLFLSEHPSIDPHPKGHSKYVLRYRSKCGHEIAVKKRVGAPLLYVTRTLAEGRLDGLDPEWLPASNSGRNSNLKTLESFRNQPLARLRVTSLDTARKAIEACVSR